MRAEQVFEVAADIVDDFANLGIVEKLTALVAAVQNQVSSPSTETQLAVTEIRESLLDTLEKSRFINYPIALQKTLDEMEVKQFLSESLSGDIKYAFEGNEITPAAALDTLNNSLNNITTLITRSNSYLESGKFFEVGKDTPKGNEFEFLVMIPREAVDNELDQFGKELTKLDRLFSIFCELSTGSRSDFKIKAISSSDLTILLHTAPAVALVIVTTLERIAAMYERLLNISTLQRGLKESNAPASVLSPLEKFIAKTLKVELEAAAREIEKKYTRKLDQGRRQELKTELRNALKEISARYDRGYLFDVRGNESDLRDEDNPDDPQDETKALRRLVAEKRQRLRLLKQEDAPILGLPEPKDEPDEA